MLSLHGDRDTPIAVRAVGDPPAFVDVSNYLVVNFNPSCFVVALCEGMVHHPCLAMHVQIFVCGISSEKHSSSVNKHQNASTVPVPSCAVPSIQKVCTLA